MTIKVFRSNNAKELLFHDFVFAKIRVLHQFSCVECPQQNSIAKKKDQHLLNVARALYFQSRVPLHLWSHCVLTATFLINHTLSPLLNHSTPFELLYKKPVDYSSFRVFGCLAFASTLTFHCTKFQPRAKPCVFLGIPNGMKAYRLYDIHAKQVFVSRNVIFHEEVFPFQFVIDTTHLSDPFPDLVLPIPLSDSSLTPTSHQFISSQSSPDHLPSFS